MEASLTCAVCLSLFEEPVTLPLCSHNFCRACVAECLGQAWSAAESASSASSSRQSTRSHDRPHQETGQEASSGRASRHSGGVTVSCPLCRKLCPLPLDGGAAALPVNTTLAEVVKLFKASNHGKPCEGSEGTSSALAPQLASLGVACEKHPGRSLQLYCRMCRRGGCGQCVSEEHCSIFHSVNLIDTVYQEEKLTFFSNLKKMRTIHQKLMKEIAMWPNDEGAVMQNEEEIIKTEFEKICNALEMRKKQLLEDLEAQKKRKEKECQVWKRMKEVHMKTIENVLHDCEKLVDECDPQRFLEVACTLNQRMKTQLELMQIASSHENQSECKQMCMDTISIVNDILALQLTAVSTDPVKGIISGDSEQIVFAINENKCEDQTDKQDAFHPVAGENTILNNGRSIPTRYMSVSATTEFRSMSHEEVRYHYYIAHQVHSDGLQTQTSALNERHTLPESQASKITTSEDSLSCLNQKKLKMQTFQRKAANETSVSSSLGFTFNTPVMNFNFSGSNNLNVFNVKESQKDSKENSLSESTVSFLQMGSVPSSHAVTFPFGTQPSFTGLSNSPQLAAPSMAALNPYSLNAVVEHSAPSSVLSLSDSLALPASSKGPNFSFKTENLVFSTAFLGKSESQDCSMRHNINGCNTSAASSTITTPIITTTTNSKPGSADSGKLFCSAFSTNSQSARSQSIKLNCSRKTQLSFFLPGEKTLQENKPFCFSKENNLGHSSFASPAPSKDLGENSNFINWACKPSRGASGKASKNQFVTSTAPSNNYTWRSNDPSMFTFKGAIKNSCDTPTSSMMPFNETKNAHEDSNNQKNLAVEKYMPATNDIPVYKELKHLMCSSSFSMGKCWKSETESIHVPQHSVACDTTTNSILVSAIFEESNRLETPPGAVKDHMGSLITNGASCMVNTDSDVEDLSQASNSSDSNSTSEYFSVSEDKILPS